MTRFLGFPLGHWARPLAAPRDSRANHHQPPWKNWGSLLHFLSRSRLARINRTNRTAGVIWIIDSLCPQRVLAAMAFHSLETACQPFARVLPASWTPARHARLGAGVHRRRPRPEGPPARLGPAGPRPRQAPEAPGHRHRWSGPALPGRHDRPASRSSTRDGQLPPRLEDAREQERQALGADHLARRRPPAGGRHPTTSACWSTAWTASRSTS